MWPMPPCLVPACWWWIWASGLLLCWQLQLSTYSVFFFFFSPSYVALWDSKTLTDLPVRGFPTVWKLLLLHDSLPRAGLHPWLFLSFIFCPTSFWGGRAAFLGAWCPPPGFRSCFMEVIQHSNDLLMNLWGRKWSPCPIPPPSWDRPPPPEIIIYTQEDVKKILNIPRNAGILKRECLSTQLFSNWTRIGQCN